MRLKDHEAVEYWHNRYQGQRAFIIGTGPSLLNVPRDLILRLKSEVTFGVNFLTNVPDWPFMPTFMCACEGDDIRRIDHVIVVASRPPRSLDYPKAKFFNNIYDINRLDPLPAYDDWVWVYADHGKDLRKGWIGGLGDTLEWTADLGYSVVACSAIQMALWVGCDPIYLLGCDATEDGHAHPEGEGDRRGKGNVDIARANQVQYRLATKVMCKVMAEAGRTLIDLTEGGTLPVPKRSLGEVLG